MPAATTAAWLTACMAAAAPAALGRADSLLHQRQLRSLQLLLLLLLPHLLPHQGRTAAVLHQHLRHWLQLLLLRVHLLL
jgi:hypothetical protein